MGIFETAARKKFRFPSVKGDLTAEQLWDLPLVVAPTREGKVDLDGIARNVSAELRSVTEESFVSVKPDPRKPELEAKLDILKHIIAVKLKEHSDAANAASRSEKRRKLLDALASQEDKELQSLSKDDILKQLADIDSGE